MEKQCLSTLRLAIPNIDPSINLLYSIYQPGLMFRLKTPLVWIDNAKYEACMYTNINPNFWLR